MGAVVEKAAITATAFYKNPMAALPWLEKAFGFETRMVVDDGQGGVIHSELGLGAKVEREPADQPHGDRVFTCGHIEDHPWSFGQTLKVMTPEEMSAATGYQIIS